MSNSLPFYQLAVGRPGPIVVGMSVVLVACPVQMLAVGFAVDHSSHNAL